MPRNLRRTPTLDLAGLLPLFAACGVAFGVRFTKRTTAFTPIHNTRTRRFFYRRVGKGSEGKFDPAPKSKQRRYRNKPSQCGAAFFRSRQRREVGIAHANSPGVYVFGTKGF